MGGFNCADLTAHLRDLATTMSLTGPVITLTTRPEAPSLGMRWDEMDGIIKSVLQFCLYFEEGYITRVYMRLLRIFARTPVHFCFTLLPKSRKYALFQFFLSEF